VSERRELLLLLVTLLGVLGVSAIDPVADRLTWFLETVPVMVAIPVLLLTWRRFPLTLVTYRAIWLFSLVLIYGGHYTYAGNPLFAWLADFYGWERNYFDRFGHFLQGVVPALLAREILLRRSPIGRGGWLFFLVTCVALAISASYEFVEWWVALYSGEAAEAFLGTQGDPWDTQWDMFLATIGAITAQLLFADAQNRGLKRIDATLLYRK
jgi:putative membrane protein